MALVALDQLVLHREAVVGIDRAFLRHQVAHVAIGGQHLEILAQVFLDGARLGRRFDDDQIVSHGTTVLREPETKNRGRAAGWLPGPQSRGSMRIVMRHIKYQIFHACVGEFLPGLAREHHQHHPFDLLQVELLGIERQQAIDHDLALAGREDAAGLERGQQAAALRVQPREFLRRVTRGTRRCRAGSGARARRPDRPASRARARRWLRRSRRSPGRAPASRARRSRAVPRACSGRRRRSECRKRCCPSIDSVQRCCRSPAGARVYKRT